jgi:hypothetical protein
MKRERALKIVLAIMKTEFVATKVASRGHCNVQMQCNGDVNLRS